MPSFTRPRFIETRYDEDHACWHWPDLHSYHWRDTLVVAQVGALEVGPRVVVVACFGWIPRRVALSLMSFVVLFSLRSLGLVERIGILLVIVGSVFGGRALLQAETRSSPIGGIERVFRSMLKSTEALASALPVCLGWCRMLPVTLIAAVCHSSLCVVSPGVASRQSWLLAHFTNLAPTRAGRTMFSCPEKLVCTPRVSRRDRI